MTDCTASVLEVFFEASRVAIEHVQKIGVAAGVQLVGALDLHAAFAKKIDNRAMQNGRAHLRFDVVADERQIFVRETFCPDRDRSR